MTGPTPASSIDELLDRAVQAINRGDRAAADALAGQVLAVDATNLDAEELLAAPAAEGTIRRLTIMFADLVDSTALSSRIEPETYRTVVGRYRDEVLRIVNRYEGHVASTKGDGLLAVFGHPTPHEDDVARAVRAGLDITAEVAALSQRVRKRFGFDINVRVGVHRGLVYLDTAQDDVYGLGANLAARMCSLAEPGTVAVSEAVEQLVRDSFRLEERDPQPVKGVDQPIVYYRAVGELDPTRPALGPLIGREREVEYLQDAWSQAVAGTLAKPGVMFLGEGGIGKSRLAAAAIAKAVGSGARVLELFGSPFHTDTGLRPVRRLLERRCGIGSSSEPAERLTKLAAEIDACQLNPAEMIPVLAPVLAIPPDADYQTALVEGTKLHDRIATAVYDYLLACLGDAPALVVIEDLHWFDPDTIEIVHKLLDANIGRLLIVITAREHASLPGDVQVFDLRPLTGEQADELIFSLNPAMPLDARREVRRRCDGIPLYIEEVVAKVKESHANSAATQVPDTLYEALLARLPPGGKAVRVAQAAAIIGSVVERGVLQSVVDLSHEDLDQGLEELTAKRILQPVRDDVWRFRHELLREVSAELVPPSLQSKLHGRIGDVLAATSATGNPEWRLVAYHYETAERYDAAAWAYEQASTVARHRGALSEARGYLARALDNIERSAPGPERDRHEIGVRLQRGFLAAVAMGHASPEAAAEFERCLELIGDNVSPQLNATLSALWSYFFARGDLDRATQLGESITSQIASVIPEWNRDANEVLPGSLAWFRGDFTRASALLETAARKASEIAELPVEGYWFLPNDPFAAMYTFLAMSRFMRGDLAGAEASLTQTHRRCQLLSFPHSMFSLAYGTSLEIWIRIEAGQLDRAAQLVGELAALGKQYGFDEWVMVAATQGATVQSVAALADSEGATGTLQTHIDTMTAVVQTWRAYDLKVFLMCYDAVLARLLTAAGQHDAARDRVGIALELADETGMHFYDGELLRVRAHISDDPDVRHTGLGEALALSREQGAPIFELRIAADDFELVGEPARAALAEAVGRFPPEASWPELARARALLG